MTPHECLAKAELCERMAFGCTCDVDRQILLVTASHWRTLAAVPEKSHAREKTPPEPEREDERELVSSS